MLEKASGSNSASTEFIWMIKAKNAYFQCERKKSTVALKKKSGIITNAHCDDWRKTVKGSLYQ